MTEPFSRRDILLAHNAGIWEGTFIRLDGNGHESERFSSHLAVDDRQGTIHADLTNRTTGNVRSMHFSEPPAEMQISPDGHWSLGPDRIGPWPWVCELCLVWGHRRRRLVVRHSSEGLESLVLVCEGRPGSPDEAPEAPLLLTAQPLEANLQLWQLRPPCAISVTTQRRRQQASAEAVTLQWQPEPGMTLALTRRYSEHGLLQPL